MAEDKVFTYETIITLKDLVAANQTAIKEQGREIQEIKASHRRDMKDQWKMISELTDELKEAQVTIKTLVGMSKKIEVNPVEIKFDADKIRLKKEDKSLICSIDGNALCVTRKDFENLQASPAVFITLPDTIKKSIIELETKHE